MKKIAFYLFWIGIACLLASFWVSHYSIALHNTSEVFIVLAILTAFSAAMEEKK